MTNATTNATTNTTANITTDTKTGKIALITGANRGLGRSMALHLAAQGVGIIGTYRSNEAEATSLIAEIEQRGARAVMLQLDVEDSDGFAAFAKAVAGALSRSFGRERFDFLVNNAGIGLNASVAETSEEQFLQLMNIHLKGPFFLTQKLLPLIADGGRIVNVSSGLTRFAMPGYSAYAMMKGGVEVWTRYLAKELGARGIAVNTLAPGAIETDFRDGALRDNEQARQHVSSVTALGRPGLPDDIGGAVAALLGEGTGWINGQRIEVSGGMVL